uniref:Uncharacterized protein n=1 Tax=Sphaerodactylus townsendi TaxID=933632 RepID=A0ACB8F9S0_9SAUR
MGASMSSSSSKRPVFDEKEDDLSHQTLLEVQVFKGEDVVLSGNKKGCYKSLVPYSSYLSNDFHYKWK